MPQYFMSLEKIDMSSTENLLTKSDQEWISEHELAQNLQYIRRNKTRSVFKLFATHVLIFLSYAGAFSAVYIRYICPRRSELDMVWSPGNGALHYRPQWINNDVFNKNIWKGKPRPDSDDAWEDLFKYMNIRVSKDELDRMNQTSVQLTDGSGDYLAGIDVLHHLHCVKTIRQFIYKDHFPHQESEQVPDADHVDHCLDAIRQQLMCRAEATMYTFEWRSDIPFPWAQLSYEHTCADFDAFLDWASTRAVDIGTPGLLDHPEGWRFAGQHYAGHHSGHHSGMH